LDEIRNVGRYLEKVTYKCLNKSIKCTCLPKYPLVIGYHHYKKFVVAFRGFADAPKRYLYQETIQHWID